MDLRKLKTLIDLVSESNISELEITEAEGRVRIVKGEGSVAVPVHTVQAMPKLATNFESHSQAPGPEQSTASLTAVSSDGGPAAAQGGVDNPAVQGNIAKSPMVGTFYRSSAPGGKPFVEVGSVVKSGETICIIEAMKILNEIEAEYAGTVTQILIKDGQAVEYGQALFVIE